MRCRTADTRIALRTRVGIRIRDPGFGRFRVLRVPVPVPDPGQHTAKAAPPPSRYDVSIESVNRLRRSPSTSDPIDDDLERGAGTERRAVNFLEHDRFAVDKQTSKPSPTETVDRLADPIDAVLGKFQLFGARCRRRCRHRTKTAWMAGIATTRDLEANQQTRALRQLAECLGDDLGRFADDLLAALPAVRPADPCEQESHVVVDLSRRSYSRARIPDAVLLADRYGWANPLDAVDVRFLHALEELPRIRRQRLDISTLPFGVDRVEGERRLPRPADTGDDHQLARGQRDVDVLEIVRPRAANDERFTDLRRLV